MEGDSAGCCIGITRQQRADVQHDDDDDDDDDDDITPSAGLVALQLPAGGIYGRVWVDYKSKTEKMTNQTIAHADITSEVLLDYLQTRGKEQKISKELLNIVAFYEECIKENVL